jgi:hypothetical protein
LASHCTEEGRAAFHPETTPPLNPPKAWHNLISSVESKGFTCDFNPEEIEIKTKKEYIIFLIFCSR